MYFTNEEERLEFRAAIESREKYCRENNKLKDSRLKNRTIYDDRAIHELRKIHNYIKYELKEDMIAKRMLKK